MGTVNEIQIIFRELHSKPNKKVLLSIFDESGFRGADWDSLHHIDRSNISMNYGIPVLCR